VWEWGQCAGSTAYAKKRRSRWDRRFSKFDAYSANWGFLAHFNHSTLT